MSGYERDSFNSEVSFCSFQRRYSFHCKFGSVNYFVLSLRKEHIRSCIVVVSEREYEEYLCFTTFIQRFKRDLRWLPTIPKNVKLLRTHSPRPVTKFILNIPKTGQCEYFQERHEGHYCTYNEK